MSPSCDAARWSSPPEPSEVAQPQELYRRGLANGVPVELIDEQGLAELEPLARTAGTALWSPTTSVADPRAVSDALAADVRRAGGRICLASPVQDGRPGRLVVAGQRWDVAHVAGVDHSFGDGLRGRRRHAAARGPLATGAGQARTAAMAEPRAGGVPPAAGGARPAPWPDREHPAGPSIQSAAAAAGPSTQRRPPHPAGPSTQPAAAASRPEHPVGRRTQPARGTCSAKRRRPRAMPLPPR